MLLWKILIIILVIILLLLVFLIIIRKKSNNNTTSYITDKCKDIKCGNNGKDGKPCNCKDNCVCDDLEVCNPLTNTCCNPTGCDYVNCGQDNGCGSICGCIGGFYCDQNTNTCTDCGNVCGTGPCSFISCPLGDVCYNSRCITPQCNGVKIGDDDVNGYICNGNEFGYVIIKNNVLCKPDCNGKEPNNLDLNCGVLCCLDNQKTTKDGKCCTPGKNCEIKGNCLDECGNTCKGPGFRNKQGCQYSINTDGSTVLDYMGKCDIEKGVCCDSGTC